MNKVLNFCLFIIVLIFWDCTYDKVYFNSSNDQINNVIE
jgi:hypothetical protein